MFIVHDIMRLSLVACTLASLLALGLCYQVPPNARKPAIPPRPPPQVVFTADNKPTLETLDPIAPSQFQQGFNPTLSLVNPDYTVGVRPGPRPMPYRPRPQPQQPSRPQQQRPQRPQRPLGPQRPYSQFIARPPVAIPPLPGRPQG